MTPADQLRAAKALIDAPVIYHGTPLTPRAALDAIMPGRAACVSFFRPDSLEAVLAVCPQVMFRPRGVQLLDAGDARRSGMGRGRPADMVASLLRLARTDAVRAGEMGDHAGQPSSTDPAQRRAAQRLAFWRAGRAGLAYGWADSSPSPTMRTLLSRLHRLDRRPEERAGGLSRLPSQDGRDCRSDGQHLAPAAHAARDRGCMGLPLFERGQHQPCAERSPL